MNSLFYVHLKGCCLPTIHPVLFLNVPRGRTCRPLLATDTHGLRITACAQHTATNVNNDKHVLQGWCQGNGTAGFLPSWLKIQQFSAKIIILKVKSSYNRNRERLPVLSSSVKHGSGGCGCMYFTRAAHSWNTCCHIHLNRALPTN